MDESVVNCLLRVFVGLKQIIEKSGTFCLEQCYSSEKMIKSIYVIKHRLIKAILLFDFIENR